MTMRYRCYIKYFRILSESNFLTIRGLLDNLWKLMFSTIFLISDEEETPNGLRLVCNPKDLIS